MNSLQGGALDFFQHVFDKTFPIALNIKSYKLMATCE